MGLRLLKHVTVDTGNNHFAGILVRHPSARSSIRRPLRRSVLHLIHPSKGSSVGPSIIRRLVCPSALPSVGPSVRRSFRPPALFMRSPVLTSINSSVCSSTRPSTRPFVHPSGGRVTSPFARPSVCKSVRLARSSI